MGSSVLTLLLVFVVAVLAPPLAEGLRRWVAIPLVVFEIALGVVFGPEVLGWMRPNSSVDLLSNFGVAMLFFLAGMEIDFARLRGRVLRRSLAGWVLALVVATALGILLAGTVP